MGPIKSRPAERSGAGERSQVGRSEGEWERRKLATARALPSPIKPHTHGSSPAVPLRVPGASTPSTRLALFSRPARPSASAGAGGGHPPVAAGRRGRCNRVGNQGREAEGASEPPARVSQPAQCGRAVGLREGGRLAQYRTLSPPTRPPPPPLPLPPPSCRRASDACHFASAAMWVGGSAARRVAGAP